MTLCISSTVLRTLLILVALQTAILRPAPAASAGRTDTPTRALRFLEASHRVYNPGTVLSNPDGIRPVRRPPHPWIVSKRTRRFLQTEAFAPNPRGGFATAANAFSCRIAEWRVSHSPLREPLIGGLGLRAPPAT